MRRAAGRVSSKLYLTPANATGARARAAVFDLPLSTYLAILLRNELRGRATVRRLAPAEPEGARVRQMVALALPAALHQAAESYAASRGGPLPRLIEALVAADMARGGPLVLLEP